MRAGAWLLALASFAAHAACDVHYTLEPRWAAQPRHFAATLSFDAGDRTSTRLAVSPDWGGVEDFHRALRGMEGGTSGVDVAIDGRAWTVTHPPRTRVTVRFEVHGGVEADKGTLQARDFYRNQLGERHFHLFGPAMLPAPEGVPSTSTPACLSFTRVPRDWSLATSLGEPKQSDTEARFEAPLDHVVRGLFVGGDFRVLRREVAGRPLVFALRGEWSFEDGRLADAGTAVIRAHREFWGDHGFARYLVSLIPNRLPSGSNGGTGLQDAFAMHASRDFAIPGRGFDFLIGHEHLHTWIPGRMGGLEPGAAQAADYWFSEGFTNYLTHRLLLRAGVWTPADYAGAVNAVIFELATSPVGRERNERIRDDFWKSDTVHRLPYLRGEVVALAFARLLERAGTSLEAVLQRLAREPAGGKTAPQRFASAAGAHVPATQPMLAAYVERGEPIPLEVGTLGPCFEGGARSRAPFDLGFDRNSFRTRTLAGVTEGGPAHKAGLRDGMAVAGASVRFGEPDLEAVVQVREGDAVREIRYLPRGPATVVMQYRPRDDAATNPECVRWLAP